MGKGEIILLDSSYPINSRNLRIVEYLDVNDDVLVITWNRQGTFTTNSDKYRIFSKKSSYGNKIKKLFYIPQYYKFVKQNIYKYNPKIVIASNWDMLVIASLIKCFHKFKLIYENRDMVTSKYNIIKLILSIIEKKALRNTDCIIMASRFYSENYSYYNNEQIVLENKVPSNIKKDIKKKSDKFRISFIGTVRFYDILVNLIKATSNIAFIEIGIYGSGPDLKRIEKYIISYNVNNAKIYGEFLYKDIGSIYANTDLVWSVYPNTDSSNKKYVVPNKYFESIYFETPGIFPQNTKVAELITELNIGYVVDPYSCQEIRALIKYICNNSDDLKIKIDNCKENYRNALMDSEIKKLDKILLNRSKI